MEEILMMIDKIILLKKTKINNEEKKVQDVMEEIKEQVKGLSQPESLELEKKLMFQIHYYKDEIEKLEKSIFITTKLPSINNEIREAIYIIYDGIDTFKLRMKVYSEVREYVHKTRRKEKMENRKKMILTMFEKRK